MAGVKLGSAFVDIRANLKPLRRGLALARKAVTIAMRGMAAAVKTAMNVARKAMMAFIGVTVLAVLAANKQEDAEVQLAAALRDTGKNVRGLLKDYKKFASGIQAVTTFGDEEVLMLMRQGLTLGVTTERLKEATKAALSLSAFGKRMKPEMAMRMFSQALRGNVSSLKSYLTELEGVTDETAQWMIINKALARGWTNLLAKAETTSGKMKQAWNAFGDAVLETWGRSVQPVLKKMAQLFLDNSAKIQTWVEDTIIAMEEVKNLFIDIWKSGEILETVKITLIAIVELAKEFGKKIGSALGNAIKRGLELGLAKVGDVISAKLGKVVPIVAAARVASAIGKIRAARQFVGPRQPSLVGPSAPQSNKLASIQAKFARTRSIIQGRILIRGYKKSLEDVFGKAKNIFGKLKAAAEFTPLGNLQGIFNQIKDVFAPAIASIVGGVRGVGAAGAALLPDEKKPIGKLGFVGLKDAWKQVSMLANPGDTKRDGILKDIIKAVDLTTIAVTGKGSEIVMG